MRDKAFDIVKIAVEDLNEELEYESLNNISDATPIFGGDDGIDSLSLVRLVVELEGSIEQQFGVHVALADEKAMSMRNSPYHSVGSLVDLIVAQVEAANG
ncbi:MAG: acyl carrier protein [Gammaproteobacteria bacterium]|nr:acyl carrier protein [Gammaproteobacteria bacterium]